MLSDDEIFQREENRWAETVTNLQRRLDAVLDLHDEEWCDTCKSVGCATRRAAEGKEK